LRYRNCQSWCGCWWFRERREVFSTQAAGGLRRPGKTDAWRKVQFADGSERIGNSGISGIENARGRAGEDIRLRASDEGGYLVVFFRPGCDAIPAKAVVEGQVGTKAPAILRERAYIFVARVIRVELALVVLAGRADEEVGEVDTGLGSREDKAAVELRNGMGIDLVGMKLRAELEGVIAEHLGECVGDLVGVVGLDELIGRGAGGVAVEVEVLDTLPVGVKRDDAGGAIRIGEALRSRLTLRPPTGWPRLVKSRR
jgi:hypothetical protein